MTTTMSADEAARYVAEAADVMGIDTDTVLTDWERASYAFLHARERRPGEVARLMDAVCALSRHHAACRATPNTGGGR